MMYAVKGRGYILNIKLRYENKYGFSEVPGIHQKRVVNIKL